MTQEHIRIHSIANTGNLVDELVSETNLRVRIGLVGGAKEVYKRSMLTLMRPSSRNYPWDTGHHPASREGNIIAGMFYDVDKVNVKSAQDTSSVTATIGTTSDEGKWQETGAWAVGAYKMGWQDKTDAPYPYPWLKPALDNSIPTVISELSKALEG